MSTDKELLQTLHTKAVKELLERIESGKASSQDLNVALNFLKHNQIQCRPEADPRLRELMEKVPFCVESEDEADSEF